MTVEYRLTAYDEADYAGVVRIAKAIDPDEFIVPEDMREFDAAQRRAGRVSSRWHAFVEGELVGNGYVGILPWIPADVPWINVSVHPNHQHQGIGRELLTRCEQLAREHGASRLLSGTDERKPRSMRFLQAAGYGELERDWRSTLDLTSWDRSPWQEAVARLTDQELIVTSVAQLDADGVDWLGPLHRLYVEVEQDVPSEIEILRTSLEDFESLAISTHRAVPEAFLVAIGDGEFVALTQPERVADRPTALAQELTGTKASHRGRGIATGIKVLALMWAQDNGYTEVRTWNSTSNAPMLAVNVKLGFEREHADITYVKNV